MGVNGTDCRLKPTKDRAPALDASKKYSCDELMGKSLSDLKALCKTIGAKLNKRSKLKAVHVNNIIAKQNKQRRRLTFSHRRCDSPVLIRQLKEIYDANGIDLVET